MIKINSFDFQHFHFPGILIFMISCCHSLSPNCLFILPAFKLQSEYSSFPSDEMGHPNFHDRWTGDWCFTHNSKGFWCYIPTCQSERYFPGSSISVPARTGKAWQRGCLQANLYLQEGDHMGWGVCNHPHMFSLLNLNALMRSSFSLKNSTRFSLFI